MQAWRLGFVFCVAGAHALRTGVAPPATNGRYSSRSDPATHPLRTTRGADDAAFRREPGDLPSDFVLSADTADTPATVAAVEAGPTVINEHFGPVERPLRPSRVGTFSPEFSVTQDTAAAAAVAAAATAQPRQQFRDRKPRISKSTGSASSHSRAGRANGGGRRTPEERTSETMRAFVKDTTECTGMMLKDYQDLGLVEFMEQQHRINLLYYYMEVRANLTETLGRQPTVDEWAYCLNMAVQDLKDDLLRSEKVRSQLVHKHLGQVKYIAKKYMGYGVPLKDLVQEGSCGLLRAAEKFDPSLGLKFSTYAQHWIRKFITRSLNKHSRMIYLPRKVHEQMTALSKIINDMSTSLGREPTEDELAQRTEVPAHKMRRYRMASQPMTSLSSTPKASLGTEHRPTDLGDQMMDNDLPSPEQEASNRLLRADMLKVLEHLPELERDVISLRYGLVDGTPRSYEEVASTISHEDARCLRTVRNAASRGLNKLRGPNLTYMLASHNRDATDDAALDLRNDVGWRADEHS